MADTIPYDDENSNMYSIGRWRRVGEILTADGYCIIVIHQ